MKEVSFVSIRCLMGRETERAVPMEWPACKARERRCYLALQNPYLVQHS
jgi:hypothetical protein